MEDTKKLQMALGELLEEDNKDIILALLPNLSILIKSYCNEHAVSQVADSAPVSHTNGENTPIKGYGLVHSNTFGAKTDFSSMHRKYEASHFGKGGYKKLTSMNVGTVANEPEELISQETYVISSEHKSEAVYQDLLPKLLQYDENIHGIIGLWRQHAEFICKFADCFNLFHLPELQDNYVATMFKYLQNGNNHLRAKVCKAIVNLLAFQYDPERRAALAKQVNEELGESRAFQIRRTFVTFCRSCAGVLTKDYFCENFYDTFLRMGDDRVA